MEKIWCTRMAGFSVFIYMVLVLWLLDIKLMNKSWQRIRPLKIALPFSIRKELVYALCVNVFFLIEPIHELTPK